MPQVQGPNQGRDARVAARRSVVEIPRNSARRESPITNIVREQGIMETLSRMAGLGEGEFRQTMFIPEDRLDTGYLFAPSPEDREQHRQQQWENVDDFDLFPANPTLGPQPATGDISGLPEGAYHVGEGQTGLTDPDLEPALTPPAIQQAERLREEIRNLRDEMREQQETAEGKNMFYNMLFNAEQRVQFGDVGLVPSDPELNAAVTQDLQIAPDGAAGLTQNMIDAVSAIMTDENLTEDEKDLRIDFLFDRAEMAIGVAQTMKDIEADLADQEALLELDNYDLLAELGATAEFVQPRHYELGVRPPGEDDILFFMDDALNDTPLVNITSVDSDLVGEMFETLLNSPDKLDDGTYDWLISQIAEELEMSPSEVAQTIANIIEETYEYLGKWEAPLSFSQYDPHGEQLGIALYEVATEMGLSPAKAQEYATNAHIHSLIAQKSGGQVGFVGEGTQRGLGGLPNDFYMALFGMSYEDMPRSARTDLFALIEYMEQFGGPQQAVNNFLSSGGWGY